MGAETRRQSAAWSTPVGLRGTQIFRLSVHVCERPQNPCHLLNWGGVVLDTSEWVRRPQKYKVCE